MISNKEKDYCIPDIQRYKKALNRLYGISSMFGETKTGNKIFFLCDGNDEECRKRGSNCYIDGGPCRHTSNIAHAKHFHRQLSIINLDGEYGLNWFEEAKIPFWKPLANRFSQLFGGL